MSVLLPLLVLGVAARMIHERPLLATIVAVVTLGSAGLRIVIVQHQQQKSAAAIAEGEQKFRALFHDNPQPTFLYDPSTGRFLEVNRAATEKYGYSHQEFLNLTVSDIVWTFTPTVWLPRAVAWNSATKSGASGRRMVRSLRSSSSLAPLSSTDAGHVWLSLRTSLRNAVRKLSNPPCTRLPRSQHLREILPRCTRRSMRLSLISWTPRISTLRSRSGLGLDHVPIFCR